MQSVILGIDPDSSKHGIAVYRIGKLDSLMSLELMELMNWLKVEYAKDSIEPVSIICHIEDVNANKAVWHGRSQSKAAYGATSQNVAKCKQAQIELMRMLDFMGVPYKLHKISKAWKKDKVLFERITGWAGRSNEDTRSAAYFGYLGLK